MVVDFCLYLWVISFKVVLKDVFRLLLFLLMIFFRYFVSIFVVIFLSFLEYFFFDGLEEGVVFNMGWFLIDDVLNYIFGINFVRIVCVDFFVFVGCCVF